ncbi:hypothetical protein HMPREF9080_00958 [Cardiobacterium valvarum F0432]|uniref:Uncharacterized protein n=1 Tax=Cardiobacterium valvarum F0432 TaxID=797473 RepID=G9ZDX4_9GAMM|nr:hypothetical protein HMPREF9080_00958 [Cardiobacterium valvarum F0432]
MHHVNGGSKHALPFGKPPSGINAGFVGSRQAGLNLASRQAPKIPP